MEGILMPGRLRRCLAGALTGAALLGATSAYSQTTSGLALDRFEPAPAGDRMFGVPSPYAAGDLTPHVMVLADYAHNPLVLKTEPADTTKASVVQSQMYLNLDIGLSLWKRVFARSWRASRTRPARSSTSTFHPTGRLWISVPRSTRRSGS